MSKRQEATEYLRQLETIRDGADRLKEQVTVLQEEEPFKLGELESKLLKKYLPEKQSKIYTTILKLGKGPHTNFEIFHEVNERTEEVKYGSLSTNLRKLIDRGLLEKKGSGRYSPLPFKDIMLEETLFQLDKMEEILETTKNALTDANQRSATAEKQLITVNKKLENLSKLPSKKLQNLRIVNKNLRRDLREQRKESRKNLRLFQKAYSELGELREQLMTAEEEGEPWSYEISEREENFLERNLPAKQKEVYTIMVDLGLGKHKPAEVMNKLVGMNKGVSSGTLSIILNKLVASGYISREGRGIYRTIPIQKIMMEEAFEKFDDILKELDDTKLQLLDETNRANIAESELRKGEKLLEKEKARNESLSESLSKARLDLSNTKSESKNKIDSLNRRRNSIEMALKKKREDLNETKDHLKTVEQENKKLLEEKREVEHEKTELEKKIREYEVKISEFDGKKIGFVKIDIGPMEEKFIDENFSDSAALVYKSMVDVGQYSYSPSEVIDEITSRGVKISYTTLAALMSIMVTRGLLEREGKGVYKIVPIHKIMLDNSYATIEQINLNMKTLKDHVLSEQKRADKAESRADKAESELGKIGTIKNIDGLLRARKIKMKQTDDELKDLKEKKSSIEEEVRHLKMKVPKNQKNYVEAIEQLLDMEKKNSEKKDKIIENLRKGIDVTEDFEVEPKTQTRPTGQPPIYKKETTEGETITIPSLVETLYKNWESYDTSINQTLITEFDNIGRESIKQSNFNRVANNLQAVVDSIEHNYGKLEGDCLDSLKKLVTDTSKKINDTVDSRQNIQQVWDFYKSELFEIMNQHNIPIEAR